jgi:hypothetical protein
MWSDENPYTTVASNSQLCYSVIVWCAVLDDAGTGSLIFECRLTGGVCLRFLQQELPRVLHDEPWNKRSNMYFQHDWGPHFSRAVRNSLNCRFSGRWIGRACRTIGQPHIQTQAHWIIMYVDGWKKWSTAWNFEGETRCSVAFRMLISHLEQSAEAVTNNERYSQPT